MTVPPLSLIIVIRHRRCWASTHLLPPGTHPSSINGQLLPSCIKTCHPVHVFRQRLGREWEMQSSTKHLFEVTGKFIDVAEITDGCQRSKLYRTFTDVMIHGFTSNIVFSWFHIVATIRLLTNYFLLYSLFTHLGSKLWLCLVSSIYCLVSTAARVSDLSLWAAC